MRNLLRRVFGSPGAASPATTDEFPLKGFETSAVESPLLDALSDAELEELNRLLPWKCFIADGHGRRFGRPAGLDKRNVPQQLPDYRASLLDNEFKLADKHVLEIGCFEGVHTVGLARASRRVTAIDSRVENVVKTMVRAGFLGHPVAAFTCDVESEADWQRLPEVDVIHHVGVLYHLRNPVEHLLKLGELARVGVMLDTHVALPHEAVESYDTAGRSCRYKRYREGGVADPFSGMYDHAKWLTLDTIKTLLAESGLGRIRIAEERNERNGPRVLLFARR